MIFGVSFTWLTTGHYASQFINYSGLTFENKVGYEAGTCSFTCYTRDLPNEHALNANNFWLTTRFSSYRYGVAVETDAGVIAWYGYIDSLKFSDDRETVTVNCKGIYELLQQMPIIANDYSSGATIRLKSSSAGDAVTRQFEFNGATALDLVKAISTRHAEIPNDFGVRTNGSIKYVTDLLDLSTVGDALKDVEERYPNYLVRLVARWGSRNSAGGSGGSDFNTIYVDWERPTYSAVELYENDYRILGISNLELRIGTPWGVVGGYKNDGNKNNADFGYYYTHMESTSSAAPEALERPTSSLRVPYVYKPSKTPQSPSAFKTTCNYLAKTRAGGSFDMKLRLTEQNYDIVTSKSIIRLYAKLGSDNVTLAGVIGSIKVDVDSSHISVGVTDVGVDYLHESDLLPNVNLTRHGITRRVLYNTLSINGMLAPTRFA